MLFRHPVDGLDVVDVKYLEAADGAGVLEATLVGKFPELFLGRLDPKLAQAGGHPDRAVEVLHRLDPAQGGAPGVGKVVFAAQHIDRKLREARRVLFVNVPRPAAPDCGEPRAVGHVEHAAQLVLELVAGPVARRAAAGETVVREATRPHDLGARVVVLGVAQGRPGALDDGAHEPLGQRIGQGGVRLAGEVALHGVHEDVGRPAGGLVGRQGVGQLRVHHRKAAAAQIAVAAALEPALLVGEHRRVAHLAARRRKGEHRADRSAGLGDRLLGVEVPDVPVVAQSVADRLGRVDHAAAAHRKQEVDPFAPAELDPLIDLGHPGVGHHPAEQDVFHPRLSQGLADPIQQPRALDAAAAIVDQRFFGALRLDELPGLQLSPFAEDHPGGGVIRKVFHSDDCSFPFKTRLMIASSLCGLS